MDLFPYLRALIVDDNPLALASLKARLVSLGFANVEVADGALMASQCVAMDSYDLVFVALEMSEISGLECLQFLRARSNLASALLIAMGANRLIRHRASAIKAGADLFLERPTSTKTLQVTLIGLLTSSNAQKAKIVPIRLGKEALRQSARL